MVEKTDPNIMIDTFISEYKDGQEKYILLSSWRPELEKDMAYPLVAEDEDGLYVSLFSTLDAAEDYIQEFKMKNIGPYAPIGLLPSDPAVLVRHLLGLRSRKVKNVIIMDNGPDAAFTTIQDILTGLGGNIKNDASAYQIFPITIYR